MRKTPIIMVGLLIISVLVGPLAGTVGAAGGTITATQVLDPSDGYLQPATGGGVVAWENSSRNAIGYWDSDTNSSYKITGLDSIRGIDVAPSGDYIAYTTEISGQELVIMDITDRSNPTEVLRKTISSAEQVTWPDANTLIAVNGLSEVALFNFDGSTLSKEDSVSPGELSVMDAESGVMIFPQKNGTAHVYTYTDTTLTKQASVNTIRSVLNYGTVTESGDVFTVGDEYYTMTYDISTPSSPTKLGDNLHDTSTTTERIEGYEGNQWFGESGKVWDGATLQTELSIPTLENPDYDSGLLVGTDGGTGVEVYEVETLAVSISGPSKVATGEVGKYTATYDGSDVTDNATFSVNNTTVATVQENGTVSFDNPGTVEVSATYEGTTDTITVTTDTVRVTLNQEYYATQWFFYGDGSLNNPPTWVNETVDYTVEFGETNVTSDAVITLSSNLSTVTNGFYPTVAGDHVADFAYAGASYEIAIPAETPKLRANYTDTPPYTVYSDYTGTVESATVHSENRNKSATVFTEFSSSNTSVLLINTSKVNPLRAQGPGTATVTLTWEDMATNTTTWEVDPVGIDLQLEETDPPRNAGELTVYNYTVSKTNESGTFNVTDTVNVTSSNSSIVTTYDVLNGYSAEGFGEATLTAEESGGSDSVNVTVEPRLRWEDLDGLSTGEIPIVVFSDWGLLSLFVAMVIAVILGLGTKSTFIAQGGLMGAAIAAWVVGLIPVYVMMVGFILTGVMGYAYQSLNVTVFKQSH